VTRTKQTTADLATDLQGAVARIYRRVRSEVPGKELGETPRSVLAHLVKQGPQTLRALSERERVSPPAMTQTVNLLETAGLVTREPDPSDGRKVLVAATTLGAELTAEVRRAKRLWLSVRLDQLPDADRHTLAEAARILDELAAS
jgi:DNA-binding MarR family transcriptional regulator